jgi:hypothetical protein
MHHEKAPRLIRPRPSKAGALFHNALTGSEPKAPGDPWCSWRLRPAKSPRKRTRSARPRNFHLRRFISRSGNGVPSGVLRLPNEITWRHHVAECDCKGLGLLRSTSKERIAKPSYGLTPVPRVRIPPSPPDFLPPFPTESKMTQGPFLDLYSLFAIRYSRIANVE